MYKPISLKITNILTYESVEFNFRQGEAVIIIGDNLDDPGQRGNGAGKSGLNEGTVIAITGSPMRDVSNKEIVRRGCDSGEVELILTNTMYRCEIRIWRKIYSGTKPGEYKMWIDKKEQKDMYSDSDTFNAYVFKTLGISKEDFYDFFVVTKDYYTPFLSKKTGDTQKKKVINRFSGAHKVDNALPLVDIDVQKCQGEIARVERLISSNEGKITLLEEQIEKEKLKFSDEGKAQKVMEIECKIDQFKDNILGYEEIKKAAQLEIDKYQDLLKKHKKVDYEKERADLSKRMDNNRLIGENLQKQIDEENTKKQGAVELKAEMDQGLAGVIECPACKHEFTLQSEDFDIDEAREVVKEITETILPDVDKLISENGRKKLALTTELTALRKELNKLEDDERLDKNKLRTWNAVIESEQEKIERANKTIVATVVNIEECKVDQETIANETSELLVSLELQLVDCMEAKKMFDKDLQKAIDNKAEVEQWLTHFKSFKSYLANKSIANIQDYTNLYLQKMGTNLSIKIEGYRMLTNKKMKEEIITTVQRDGFPTGSYGCFSGGEKGRIDIAVIVAMQSLININSSTGGLDLLIIDEVMDSVDSLGLENIVGALQNIDRTIMIVSQVEVNALSEHTIVIRKQNSKSEIVCQKPISVSTSVRTEESQSSKKVTQKTETISSSKQPQQSVRRKKSTSKL